MLQQLRWGENQIGDDDTPAFKELIKKYFILVHFGELHAGENKNDSNRSLLQSNVNSLVYTLVQQYLRSRSTHALFLLRFM